MSIIFGVACFLSGLHYLNLTVFASNPFIPVTYTETNFTLFTYFLIRNYHRTANFQRYSVKMLSSSILAQGFFETLFGSGLNLMYTLWLQLMFVWNFFGIFQNAPELEAVFEQDKENSDIPEEQDSDIPEEQAVIDRSKLKRAILVVKCIAAAGLTFSFSRIAFIAGFELRYYGIFMMIPLILLFLYKEIDLTKTQARAALAGSAFSQMLLGFAFPEMGMNGIAWALILAAPPSMFYPRYGGMEMEVKLIKYGFYPAYLALMVFIQNKVS